MSSFLCTSTQHTYLHVCSLLFMAIYVYTQTLHLWPAGNEQWTQKMTSSHSRRRERNWIVDGCRVTVERDWVVSLSQRLHLGNLEFAMGVQVLDHNGEAVGKLG